ncbi:DNA N(6)-methyladenine demethylase ALKBH1D-like [Rutidosis leptorrhynchoides]|uniref:DNA N(6)-methyladenine demethylase ALKBH1D-like n=1 Tax=Rutidosis leptorrhynchoides TaxID=125765 RepID=UPI003A999A6B
MTMMKSLKGMVMMMMKPHSLIPFRSASVSVSLHSSRYDNSHHDDTYKPNHNTRANNKKLNNKTEPFSLILPRSTESLCGIEKQENLESSCLILGSGLVLLKNYISVSDQVEIVNTCQEFGMGRGEFYLPNNNNKGRYLMCFGRNWDPIKKYDSKKNAPPLPHQLISLAVTSIKDSQAFDDVMPSMEPDICLVNFYTTAGRLALHQDLSESKSSLKRGLPVVTVSVGDAAKFLYGNNEDVNKANEALLESGDVLIFGGKSRLIYHGVKNIIPNSAPLSLLQQTMLKPGRLSLTFRQF